MLIALRGLELVGSCLAKNGMSSWLLLESSESAESKSSESSESVESKSSESSKSVESGSSESTKSAESV